MLTDNLVLLLLLIAGTVNTTTTRNVYCTTDRPVEEMINCSNSWHSANIFIYCKNVNVQKGDRLRLQNQTLANDGIHFIIFSSATGHIDETAMDLFPKVRRVVVDRSDLTGIDLKFETREFAIINSNFPKLTRETLKGVKYIVDFALLDNPRLQFETGAFKDLKNLTTLLISNQTIPRLQRNFLEGVEHLRLLALIQNNLTEIDQDAFIDQSYLQTLHLDNNPLESFKPNISKLSNLKTLSLINTNLKTFSFDYSASLQDLKLPTRILLHYFSNSTTLKIKYPELGVVSIVKEDQHLPEIRAMSEKLNFEQVDLSFGNRLLPPPKDLYQNIMC